MKAARLKGDLMSRKGAARPVPSEGARHRNPSGRAIVPVLAAVDPGSAKRPAKGPVGNRDQELKRDKFGRARVSLRLDSQRHLRLRLLAAHSQLSLQESLIAALDAYLGDEARSVNGGTCDCLQEAGDPSQDDEPQAAGVKDLE